MQVSCAVLPKFHSASRFGIMRAEEGTLLFNRARRPELDFAHGELTPDAPVVPTEDVFLPPAGRERRVFWGLAVLALAMVLVAIALNWFSVVNGPERMASGSGGPLSPSLAVVTLSKNPTMMLPGDIIGYEDTALHGVPEQEKTAAEAIYQTTDMRVEQQVSIGAYARAEGYPSQQAAHHESTRSWLSIRWIRSPSCSTTSRQARSAIREIWARGSQYGRQGSTLCS